MARWMLMVTQVLKSTAPIMPSCLEAPSRPFSAMKRKALDSSRASAPWRTEPALQNFSCACLACLPSLFCSASLVKITYQEPMLMMIMMISVPLATMSPWAHRALRP